MSFELPEPWRSEIRPRRGTSALPVDPDPAARKVVDEILAKVPGFPEAVVASEYTDPALRAPAAAWLTGDPRATPAGAALIATAAAAADWPEAARHPWFAEVWLAEHGIRFAAEAATELLGLHLVAENDRELRRAVRHDGTETAGVRRRRSDEHRWSHYFHTPEINTLLRVRLSLATAPAGTYAETVKALADYRSLGAYQRCATSVLAPTETAWVAEDCAAAIADGDTCRLALLRLAAGTAEQAGALAEAYPRAWRGGYATLIDGVGPDAAVAPLFRFFDRLAPKDADERRPLLALIALLPVEDAVRGLIDRATERHVRPALIEAARRFPALALPLLAEAPERSGVTTILRALVLADPARARELAGPSRAGDYTVSDRAAARIRSVLAGAERPVATPAELPDLLTSPPWRAPKTATGPLALLPPKLPRLPDWIDPDLLPPVRLRSGTVLPAEVSRDLAMVFALGRPGTPYPGVEVVRELLEPADLAGFTRALFQAWISDGAASGQSWILEALALTGDDETVRVLTPYIMIWPGESAHARATAGVRVLAGIGTELALRHLNTIAERSRFATIKTAATYRLAEVAEALGLGTGQLADRLVPDLGLAGDGSLTLEYGPRRFTVGFDEQMRPYVLDAVGRRLTSLPRPGARDDAALAPAAHARFTALKKDARAVAVEQIGRLERAMVAGRRWSLPDFHRYLVDHPLLRHLSRRLLWSHHVPGSPGAPGCFRVAEDGSPADVDDETVELAETGLIGLVHPIELDAETLARWSGLFADYEILQPFPQLARETGTLTAEEAASRELTRFRGRPVPTGAVLGLERRGWRRESAGDNGVQSAVGVSYADAAFSLDLDPGIVAGMVEINPEQTLGRVLLQAPAGTTLGDLTPVTVSELLRDLIRLTS
ncbi:DUF4132 domain-containing protein [Actinoplanes sp. NPDC051851]|uniref:DUF4132 domain-containing protein n=1 Tax=Actinoplanes sp. NPDC051851 TaxID=3154753 RepID=UPI00341ED435